eukprot:TRINITY_DN65238_c3_g3_i1.p1 TRINITY_DN65238_c3_g3~~TRINITY_DN65238_c3_g3_i1.p1  ORF type:complete len:757 (+),score=155.22 TRINITY_DN65238_c3_g3_i1:64-2334(+)
MSCTCGCSVSYDEIKTTQNILTDKIEQLEHTLQVQSRELADAVAMKDHAEVVTSLADLQNEIIREFGLKLQELDTNVQDFKRQSDTQWEAKTQDILDLVENRCKDFDTSCVTQMQEDIRELTHKCTALSETSSAVQDNCQVTLKALEEKELLWKQEFSQQLDSVQQMQNEDDRRKESLTAAVIELSKHVQQKDTTMEQELVECRKQLETVAEQATQTTERVDTITRTVETYTTSIQDMKERISGCCPRDHLRLAIQGLEKELTQQHSKAVSKLQAEINHFEKTFQLALAEENTNRETARDTDMLKVKALINQAALNANVGAGAGFANQFSSLNCYTAPPSTRTSPPFHNNGGCDSPPVSDWGSLGIRSCSNYNQQVNSPLREFRLTGWEKDDRDVAVVDVYRERERQEKERERITQEQQQEYFPKEYSQQPRPVTELDGGRDALVYHQQHQQQHQQQYQQQPNKDPRRKGAGPGGGQLTSNSLPTSPARGGVMTDQVIRGSTPTVTGNNQTTKGRQRHNSLPAGTTGSGTSGKRHHKQQQQQQQHNSRNSTPQPPSGNTSSITTTTPTHHNHSVAEDATPHGAYTHAEHPISHYRQDTTTPHPPHHNNTSSPSPPPSSDIYHRPLALPKSPLHERALAFNKKMGIHPKQESERDSLPPRTPPRASGVRLWRKASQQMQQQHNQFTSNPTPSTATGPTASSPYGMMSANSSIHSSTPYFSTDGASETTSSTPTTLTATPFRDSTPDLAVVAALGLMD